MTLNDLTSPTSVKLAIHECDRLGREEFLLAYGFRPAREYFLLWNGKEYDSKAIAGVAYGFQYPDQGPLGYDWFSGGRGKSDAAGRLSKLGFTIHNIERNPKDWTLEECEITADAYCECLKKKQAQVPFVRQHAIRNVAKVIDRSEGAVDRKFQNIDSVLFEAGLPRLGNAVASHAQELIGNVILDTLARRMNSVALSSIQSSPSTVVPQFVDPPQSVIGPEPSDRIQRAMKVNFTERELQNRQIGTRGEELVMELERSRLMQQGGPQLVEKLQWVSVEQGDGLGYDIESVDENGAPVFIEVKATTQGKNSPFFITNNELMVARREGSRFKLYRVYDLFENPKIYVLNGPLDEKLTLQPRVYTAFPCGDRID